MAKRFSKLSGAIRTSRAAALAAISAVALTGCMGGTTYGTGVSQEKQTLNDMYNMFTLKQPRRNIDYSPRPDLVVPANKDVLPEPLDSEATTSSPEWPETPEERIARIRAQAGEVDPRTGEVSMAERLRPKEGIAIEPGYGNRTFSPGLTDRDGNPLYRGEASQATRAEVLKRKAELSVSANPTRRYLTDPPVEYRIPAATAPSGPGAYTDEEISEREKAERAARIKATEELVRE